MDSIARLVEVVRAGDYWAVTKQLRESKQQSDCEAVFVLESIYTILKSIASTSSVMK